MSADPDHFDLPPKLAKALRETYAHRAEVPPARERFILSAARARLGQRPRHILRWTIGLAAGVAAVLTFTTWLHHPAPPKQPLARGDLNADGAVNMVDALVLARHLAANDKTDPAWDLNHDGVIDQKDVDTLATAAVNLKQPGLARQSLPRLRDLGIDRPPAGLASASGTPTKQTLAKANPTSPTSNEEAHQ
jgi:hypothetical protein